MQFNMDDPAIRDVIWTVCKRYEIDDGLISVRDFFKELLSTYEGGDELTEFEQWLDREIPLKFPALNKRPLWLQSREWPFANGLPMVFVGQIDIGVENTPDFRKYFHDYTSFYLFMPQGRGHFEVIMQQM